MITLRKEEMAHIRKLRRKWQAQVRKQKIKVTKSFWKKSDASNWAYRTEAQIETGSYLGAKKIVIPFDPVINLCFAFQLIDSPRIILSRFGLGGAQPKPLP